jgi:hypothetical protein
MTSTDLIKVMSIGIQFLYFALPIVALGMLGFSSFINWNYKRTQKAVGDEMQRLMEIYVTQGRWDAKDSVISRIAAKTLKSKLIIK